MPTSTVLKRLYLIQVASLPPVDIPIVCYLVQTEDGKNILIDSGLPAQFQTPAGRQAAVMGKSVVEQLAELDIQPADIDMIVCTHFDLDHCGHNDEFPNAELVVQKEQLEVALGGHQRFALQRSHWELPAERYRIIEGDTTLLAGLQLIESSGHVPGHQSVLLSLPESGNILLAIDAITVQDNFRPDREAAPLDLDGERAIASTLKLLELAEREHVQFTIFGHDAQQWAGLKKLPEYYG